MKKTIEERAKEVAEKCDHCYPRMGGACRFCLEEALLEARNEALEECANHCDAMDKATGHPSFMGNSIRRKFGIRERIKEKI